MERKTIKSQLNTRNVVVDNYMNINIVVAHSKENVIGVNNTIPWKLPSDLKNFKKITSGKIVIMGRKTFESIPDKFKPLPKRRNVVLTRNKDWKYDGVEVVHTVQEAIKLIADDETFIIGGEAVYKSFIPFSTCLYISYVDVSLEGDAYFPVLREYNFPAVFSHSFDEEGDQYPYCLKVHRHINFPNIFDEMHFKSVINIV